MAAQPIRKILIAMDGSDDSFQAFEYFRNYILKDRDDVFLFHCSEPDVVSTISVATAKAIKWRHPSPEKQVKPITQPVDLLKTMNELISDSGFKGTLLHVTGTDPGTAIAKAADDIKSDLILIGARGKGCNPRTTVGTVSYYVMHHVRLPTIICKSAGICKLDV